MLGPDEPRYTAIGQAMAETGDWVTPRLWGTPWFEKPALLYWMTAAGFRLGLGEETAPRAPVAVLSIIFLVFFGYELRTESGSGAGAYGAILLGTSVGWLTYSHVAITDLPMSVFFAAAMFLSTRERGARPWLAGVLLGLAILAKGLVPLVLFAPALWFLRDRWRDAAQVLLAALITAAPWYALVTLRNGPEFITEFFWKHQFGRFTSDALQHAQPVWFYVPVLLAGLFPWTPVLGLLGQRGLFADRRARFLASWSVFGFVFFSLSVNKLPGYLLPLLPAIAALNGMALARASRARLVLALSAGFVWLIPAIASGLPLALSKGFTKSSFHFSPLLLAPMLLAAGIVWWLDDAAKRPWAVSMIAISISVAVGRLVLVTYPVLDQAYSARPFWEAHVAAASNGTLCVEDRTRTWRYGLNYYAKRVIPDCN